MDFGEKYGAGLFDPNDPRDARADAARQILVSAFSQAQGATLAKTGEDMQDIAAGLMVGLVMIMAAHCEATDQNHAAIRSGLIGLVPLAVDMMRSSPTIELPPLSDGN